MDVAVSTYERLAETLGSPTMPESPPAPALDLVLAHRLAKAKVRLDRMEQDLVSRDLSALMAARVEFMLASRALADHLIARDFHHDLCGYHSMISA